MRSLEVPQSLRYTKEIRRSRIVHRSGLSGLQDTKLYHLEVTMWNKPEYTEMRFGFEVTMYIANR